MLIGGNVAEAPLALSSRSAIARAIATSVRNHRRATAGCARDAPAMACSMTAMAGVPASAAARERRRGHFRGQKSDARCQGLK